MSVWILRKSGSEKHFESNKSKRFICSFTSVTSGNIRLLFYATKGKKSLILARAESELSKITDSGIWRFLAAELNLLNPAFIN